MVANRAIDAVVRGDLGALKSISDSELCKNKDEYGANCLHYAARTGNIDILEFLIKVKGLNETKRTNVGATPAHDASATGKMVALQWILANTSCAVDDQDGTGATVFHLAARYCHVDIMTWLLNDMSCDIMKKTASGALPLHFAVVGGRIDIVKQLLKEGPITVNMQMDNGATAVYLACQSGRLDVLKFLMESVGASLKMKAFDGMSCLHGAAQAGHLQCVEYLVEEQKCNVNDRDFDGATPLHFAASQGHYRLVEWLMKHGRAKITLDNLGGSPLHNAVELDQIQCVKILLKNGCSPDIADNSGLTAIELAEKCLNDNCVIAIREFLNQAIIDDLTSDGSGSSTSDLDFDLDFNFDYRSPPISIPPLSPQFASIPYRSPSPAEFFQEVVNGGGSTNGVTYAHIEINEREKSPRHCVQSNETGECEGFSRKQLSSPEPNLHSLSPLNVNLSQEQQHHRDNLYSTSVVQQSQPSKPSDHHSRQLDNPDLELLPPSYLSSECANSDLSSTVSSLSSPSYSGDQATASWIPTAPKITNYSVTKRQQAPLVIQHKQLINSYPQNRTMNNNIQKSSSGHHSRSENKVVSNGSPGSANVLISNGTGSVPEKNASAVDLPNGDLKEAGKQAAMSLYPPKVLNSAIASNTDLISQIKVAAGGSTLKKTKKSNQDGRTMVFAFGLPNKPAMNGPSVKQDETPKQVVLEGEYDPKNFLEKAPKVDEIGREIPPWKQQVLARQLAEKAKEEDAKRRQFEEREARFKNVPAWKRALIEKKEAEAKAEREKTKKANQKKTAAKSVSWQKNTDT